MSFGNGERLRVLSLLVGVWSFVQPLAQAQEVQDNPPTTSTAGGGVAEQSARGTLGTQSVLLETAIQSALNEVQGVRAQLKVVPASPKDAMDQFKMYRNRIQDDMKVAKAAEDKLSSQLNYFPIIASNDDTKMLQSAISNLMGFQKTWSSRASDDKYWLNRTQSLSDLDNLSKQLSTALNFAKTFNTNQLGLSVS